MNVNKNEPLWVERYRPQVIADCILPDDIKNQFQEIKKSGRMPNLLLKGGPGTGKTTIARALCNELGVDWIIINASEDNGIDVLRTKIKDFASTASFSDSGKCVILDEADHLTPQAQAAFRGSIEAFSKTCSFVFTCNFPNKIIEPIHSRTVSISFDIKKEQVVKLQTSFFARVCEILKNENVEYDKKTIASIIQRFYPDNRRILGQLQEFSRSGFIGPEALTSIQEVSIEQLVANIKAKKFKEIRQWCADNADNDISTIYGKLYRCLTSQLVPDSIPELILILEDYQRYDTVVPDKEVHLAAMCVNIMLQVNFK